MSDYHSLPQISRSSLMTFRESPHIYAKQYITKEMPPTKETPPMKFGTVSHVAILQRADLEKTIAVIPNNLLASNGAIASKEAKAWKAAAEADGKRVLKDHEKRSELNDVYAVRDAILSHHVSIDGKTICLDSIINNPRAISEHQIIWEDPETGLPMRSMLDFSLALPSGLHLIIDIKTIGDLAKAEEKMQFDYLFQPPMYTEAIKQTTSAERVVFLFVFVETKAPWRVRVHRMSDQMFEDAYREWRSTIRDFLKRVELNDWRDPGENEVTVVERKIWEKRV